MVNNIIGVSEGVVDNAKGMVTVPLSTQSVTITLGDLPGHTDLELDREALEIGYANGDSSLSVTRDVTLPTAGEKGSEIAWLSNKPETITNAGKVVRPSGTTEVTLTATLRKDGKELQKTFVLKVLKKADGNNPNNGSNNGNNGSNNGNNGSANGSNNGNNNGSNNGSSGGTNQPQMKDIQNHWAQASIQSAVERKIVNGYPDGTFRPNAILNRSEFTVMLGRALNFSTDQTSPSFGDSNRIPAYAKPYVAKAVQAGIVTGYGDQNFYPDRKITRLELIAMIVRALNLKTDTKGKAPFADAEQIPQWGQSYVAAAYEAGLIKGKSNNRFAPNDEATRAEAVTLVLKMMEYLETK
jgi:hypothetical protein